MKKRLLPTMSKRIVCMLLALVVGSSTCIAYAVSEETQNQIDQTKKEKEARKNQRIIEIKEIRMSPGIGENDFNTKLKNGQKFLLDGDRLKVTVRFRGREMAHTNIGEQLLTSFAAQCAEIATMDKNPKMEGRNMFMFLSPKAPDKQANKK